MDSLCDSLWWFRRCAARLSVEHQRRRGVPSGGLQRRCRFHPAWRHRRLILIPVSTLQAIRNQIAEAQKIAGGSGSEQDIAEAKVELEV